MSFVNKDLIKNSLIFSGGIILFLIGCVGYGIILNSREKTLKDEMMNKNLNRLGNVHILIDRNNYKLFLYTDSILVKEYKAVFGNSIEAKIKANDKATPIGEYQICDIDTNSIYEKFLKLNYPNLKDAEEGLRKKYITQEEYEKIRYEYFYVGCTDSNTALGGNIGIHGIGNLNFIFKNLPFVYNWTDGSIAVSNESINEIYSVVKIGTKVVITK
ncbi:MAG: hypothetical protein STSR0008_19380 [Ignavibacterium sp.]